jgi:hypothetical protein
MIRQYFAIALLLSAAAALATDCQPKTGFELALSGQAETPSCEGRTYRIDFELGRNLRLLRQEQTDLEAAPGDLAAAENRGRKLRLQVIARELEQLEGLARIRGLLPPQAEHQQP